MRRYLGISGLLLLAGGLVFGITGPVAGEVFGQTGYGEETVRGFALGEDEEAVIVDARDDDELDEEVAPGQAVRFVAGGFGPDSDVIIEFRSEPVTLLFTDADGEGLVDVVVRVPDNASEGVHEIVAVGTDPEGNDLEVGVKMVVDDNPNADDSSWVLTGSIGVLIGMLLVFGVAWRVVNRRRTAHAI